MSNGLDRLECSWYSSAQSLFQHSVNSAPTSGSLQQLLEFTPQNKSLSFPPTQHVCPINDWRQSRAVIRQERAAGAMTLVNILIIIIQPVLPVTTISNVASVKNLLPYKCPWVETSTTSLYKQGCQVSTDLSGRSLSYGYDTPTHTHTHARGSYYYLQQPAIAHDTRKHTVTADCSSYICVLTKSRFLPLQTMKAVYTPLHQQRFVTPEHRRQQETQLSQRNRATLCQLKSSQLLHKYMRHYI